MADPIVDTEDPQTAPAAAEPPAVVVQPLQSTSTTASSSRVIPSAASAAALKQLAAAGQGTADAQRAVGAAQANTSEFTAQGQAAQAEQLDQQQQAMQEAADRRAAAMETARANATAAEEKVADYKFHDYWKDKSTGSKILAVIGRALTGFGGGDNANDAISQAIATDFDRQKAELGSMQKVAEWKRQGVQDIDAHYEHELAAMEKQYAAGLAATARRYEAVAIRAKVPEDQARNNVVVQQLLQQAAQVNAQSNARFDRQATYTHAQGQADKLVPAAKGAPTAKDMVRDEGGQPLGYITSGRGGVTAFTTRDSDYARAQKQLEALAADIAQNGDRVYGPEATKRRNVLKHNADIAVATVSPLGKTDEAMKAEAASIGEGGAWTATSANPEAVANKIEELKAQRQRYRQSTLIPLSAVPASPAAAAAGGGTSPAAPGAAPSPPGPLDPGLVKDALKLVRDRRAPPEVRAKAQAIVTQNVAFERGRRKVK